MTSADSCRMGGIEGVGTVELEYVGRLLRMGCDFLLMPVSGSVGSGKPPWEQNGLPWKHFVEKQWGAGEAERESLIEWEGRREEANLFCLIGTKLLCKNNGEGYHEVMCR